MSATERVCFNCNKHVGEEFFCFGCLSHVCADCDMNLLLGGRHAASDHLDPPDEAA